MDNYWTVIDMRLGSINVEANPNVIVKRNAWHINPVRTEYAKKYKFQDISYGEDWLWFEQVIKELQTEAHTDAVIHSYQHSASTSEADQIGRWDVDFKDAKEN